SAGEDDAEARAAPAHVHPRDDDHAEDEHTEGEPGDPLRPPPPRHLVRVHREPSIPVRDGMVRELGEVPGSRSRACAKVSPWLTSPRARPAPTRSSSRATA